MSGRTKAVIAALALLLLAAAVLVIAFSGLYPALPLLAVALAALVLVFYRDEWVFDNSARTMGDVLGLFVPVTGREFAYSDIDGIEVSSFWDGKRERYSLAIILKEDGTRIDIADGRDEKGLVSLAGRISGFTGLKFY